MKIDSTEIFKGSAFFDMGPSVALMRGVMEPHDIIKMKNWVMAMHIDCEQDGVLLIDSEGGASDPSIIALMLQTPIHTHVLGNASSFAAVAALAGSYKTAVEGSAMMFHKSRWKDTKEPERVFLDEEVLFKHRYKMISMVSSILPGGGIKELVCEAMLGKEDVYISAPHLYEKSVLDEITSFKGGELELYDYCRVWYDRTYNKERLK